MNVKELLPIGTIVRLKGGQKRVMIFGIIQTSNSDNTDYDYIGVIYPEGNIGEQGQFLFYHSDIEQIIFRGFEDEERTQFIDRLAEFYQGKQ